MPYINEYDKLILLHDLDVLWVQLAAYTAASSALVLLPLVVLLVLRVLLMSWSYLGTFRGLDLSDYCCSHMLCSSPR